MAIRTRTINKFNHRIMRTCPCKCYISLSASFCVIWVKTSRFYFCSPSFLLFLAFDWYTCMALILLPVLSFKGLRDDPTCLLDEDLSSLCLRALHRKMCNTEQILKSAGVLVNKIGSLQECNDEPSKYGPENFKADWITVKFRPGQQTAPGRNNICFASCSGQLHSITYY